MMRYQEIRLTEIRNLDEYKVITAQHQLSALKFDGQHIGNIMAGSKVFRVLRGSAAGDIGYSAVPRDDTDSDTKCSLGFTILGGNALMLKNAWTDPDFRGMGLASELFHFVNKLDRDRGPQPILSDYELSPDGEAFINSLTKSNKFTTRVHDFSTNLTYDMNEVDGVDILNPKQDDRDDHIWNGKTGQRFFYVFETKTFRWIDQEGQERLFEASPERHVPYEMLQPFAYFDIGDM